MRDEGIRLKHAQVVSQAGLFMAVALLVSCLVFLWCFSGQDITVAQALDQPDSAPAHTSLNTAGIQATTQLSGHIDIAGSSTVRPLVEELASNFVTIHPSVTFTIEGGGSGYGIQAAGHYTIDMGMASRWVRDDEFAQFPNLRVYPIAFDSLALVTHPDLDVSLSGEQVRDIFTGTLTNWSQVGGPDAAIILVSLQEGSGLRELFEGFFDVAIHPSAIITDSAGGLRTLVTNMPHAIGYLILDALDGSVRPVPLDGVAPTLVNIANGSYSYVRPLSMVTNGRPDELSWAFLDFIYSPLGQALISDTVFIPASAIFMQQQYVSPNGLCGGIGPCYDSVQAAVNGAEPGDTIKLATGTYTGVHARGTMSQVIYITKTVTLKGGYEIGNWGRSDPQANPTILDAQGQGRVLYISGEISATLEGLEITGGDANGSGGKNGGSAGGGLYVTSATLTISNCQIYGNQAGNDGGGGLAARESRMLIVNNGFRDNQASGSGGGLDLFDTSEALIEKNLIANNLAASGGGLNMGMFSGILTCNRILSNTAANDGGGLAIFGGNTWDNNVLADNQATGRGSAIYVHSGSPTLRHTTIARNTGGDGSAIYVTTGPVPFPSQVTLLNTVLVSHSVGISVTTGHTVTVDAILWYNTHLTVSVAPGGSAVVGGEQAGHPAFAADGYHLTADSAAIDSGQDAGVATDIDGDPRPIGQGYDLGADEFEPKFLIYLPLVVRIQEAH